MNPDLLGFFGADCKCIGRLYYTWKVAELLGGTGYRESHTRLALYVRVYGVPCLAMRAHMARAMGLLAGMWTSEGG